MSGLLTSESGSGYSRFVYVAAVTCALGGLLFGYDTGVISGALLFIKKDLGLSDFLQSLVVSAVLIGAVFGAGSSGALADRFGRRNMALASAVVFFVGALGSAFAPTVTWLVIARIVLGLAVGASTVIVPLYISELSPTDIRGVLTALFQFAITIGIVIAYLVNYVLSGSGAWRWMLGLAIIPAVILGVGMWFLPDSPRWLVKENRNDEARRVLERVRNDEDEINEEMKSMEEAEQREEAG